MPKETQISLITVFITVACYQRPNRSVIKTVTSKVFKICLESTTLVGFSFAFFFAYRPLFKPHSLDIQQSQEVDWT